MNDRGSAPAPAGPTRQLSNLQLRIVSAVILAAIALLLTWLGGAAFRLMAAVIAGAVFYEWTRMTRPGRSNGSLADIAMLVFAVLLLAGAPAWLLWLLIPAGALALAFGPGGTLAARWDAAGFIYAALSGTALALLRDSDGAGLKAILFLFAVVWATDILAYFTGRALGGPKLAPSISPGKTWSGAAGGTLGGVAAALAVLALAGESPTLAMAAIAFLLSIVSQAGDLFESWVKRRKGFKDSGHLIPGHGGVMDRVDGLVAAAFALYVMGCAAGSIERPARALFGL